MFLTATKSPMLTLVNYVLAQDLRFSWKWRFQSKSSALWHPVALQYDTSVLENFSTSIFRMTTWCHNTQDIHFNVVGYQHFRWPCCLHPEDCGRVVLWNGGILLQHCTASQLETPWLEYTKVYLPDKSNFITTAQFYSVILEETVTKTAFPPGK